MRTEFINAISKRSADGQTVNETEFLEYYADVNCTLPYEKEEYFTDLVVSTWGITSASDYVSAERLADLEVILYEKVRQKTNTSEDEGKTLKKAFKYFDVQERGVIDIKQFAATLAKFGCSFTEKEIQAMFAKYDKEQSGKLRYDEFCGLFAQMGSGVILNVNPVFEIARQPPFQTLQKLSADLLRKNELGVQQLARIFARVDKNRSGIISRTDFTWALKEATLAPTKTEYDNIYRFFDKNHDDKINYREFLFFLRGDLTGPRLDVVRRAFEKLDSQGQGRILVDDLRVN